MLEIKEPSILTQEQNSHYKHSCAQEEPCSSQSNVERNTILV